MLWRCTPEEAMAKIGGYTLALDMTDRQAQVLTGWDKKQFWDQRHWDVDHLKGEAKKKGHPWSVSKGWDTSLPVSPKVVFYILAFREPNGNQPNLSIDLCFRWASFCQHPVIQEESRTPTNLKWEVILKLGSRNDQHFLLAIFSFFKIWCSVNGEKRQHGNTR